MTAPGLYPIVHLKGEGIDIAFTHTAQYGEEYYSFVNGQHTTQGGTHQSAFKEHIARTIKETLTDRTGDDIHESDTRQELMSLSARFGLTITFASPDRDKTAERLRQSRRIPRCAD